jgi:hypothetical protein
VLTSLIKTAITPKFRRLINSDSTANRAANLGDAIALIQQVPDAIQALTPVNGGEIVLGIVPASVTVTLGAVVLAAGSVAVAAAGGVNYVTVNVNKRTAGGNAVLLASLNDQAGFAAFTPLALTLASVAPQLAAGDVITVSVVATGTGTLAAGAALVSVQLKAN